MISPDIFLWLGSAALMVCSVPQCIQSVRQGHSRGLNRLMLWLWVFGMGCCLVFFIDAAVWPMVMNYAFNMFVSGTITWYSYFPRTTSGQKETSPSKDPSPLEKCCY
jgi:uncharacterized protein with PQ loop repeat